MPEAGIRIEGLTSLRKIMEEVGSLKPVKIGMASGAIHLKGKIAKPPPVSRRPQPFVSDKQRRGFFAKLRSGEIEVPYRRGISPGSERLGQRWTVQAKDGGLTWVVGSNASYGELVQARRMQTFYHKVTGWKTIEDVTEQEKNTVARGVKREIDRALARAR